MTERTCISCWYCRSVYDVDGRNTGEKICRRYRPGEDGRGSWYSVSPWHWCDEYRPKTLAGSFRAWLMTRLWLAAR